MTARNVHVRDATDSDSPAIADLLGQLGYPSEAADIPGRLSDVASGGGTVVLAVDDDDTPLGLISLTRHPGIHSNNPTVYINALVIANGARGLGVGKTLVAYARRWGLDNGCDWISVTSAERRDGAHKFYPAVGMPYTGRRFSAPLSSSDA